MKKFEDFTEEEILDLIGDGTFSIKERLRVGIMTKENRGWPTFDGKQLDRNSYVTASEANRCARELVLNKRDGMETVEIPDFWDSMDDETFKAHLLNMSNDDMRGIFERGNTIEEWAVNHLIATSQPGEVFLCLGSEQRSFYSDKSKVSGTPDGLFVNTNSMTFRVLEFKSTQNPIVQAKADHKRQLGTNMGLIAQLANAGKLDAPFDLPLSEMTLEGGNLIYIGTDNWLDLTEFKFDAYLSSQYQAAGAKARSVFVKTDNGVELRKPEEVEPEGLQGKSNGCYFCRHKSECAAIEESHAHKDFSDKLQNMLERTGRAKPLKAMPSFKSDRATLSERIMAYDMARAKENQGKKEKDEAKKAITALLDNEAGRAVNYEDEGLLLKASLSETTRKGGVDDKKLDAFLSAYDKTTEDFRKAPSKFDTLRVTVKEDADE